MNTIFVRSHTFEKDSLINGEGNNNVRSLKGA